LKKSNKIQQCADIYLPLNYTTCFARPSRPSSGFHKTVVAASGTDILSGEQAFSNVTKPVLIWSRLKKLVPQIRRSVPEAAITVLRTPNDGRDGRPKHVQ